MLARLSRLRRSLLAQVLVVMMAALVIVLVALVVLLLTFASLRAFPFALIDSGEPLVQLVALVEEVPEEVEPLVMDAFSSPVRRARLGTGFPPGAEPVPRLRARLLSGMSQAPTLAGRELRFRYLSPRRVLGHASESGADVVGLSALEVNIGLTDGRVLTVLFAPAALFAGRPLRLILLLFVAVVSIAAVSAVLIAQAFRPLSKLEQAAEGFGHAIDPEPVRESGAEEIRRVARALNRMQARVKALMAERARVVSAIAHDVRTGVTRIRLRLERLEGADVAAIERDLDQMRFLIDDMLTYARSEQPSSRREIIDLVEFVRAYVRHAPVGLTLEPGELGSGFAIAGDPSALTRALDNLTDNARRYAGGVSITMYRVRGGFEIQVLDRGPGIPDDQLDAVFEPFFRLEASRSRRTGGGGLGLGIARALIRAQGGDVRLENRDGGGLRAVIAFPRDAAIH